SSAVRCVSSPASTASLRWRSWALITSFAVAPRWATSQGPPSSLQVIVFMGSRSLSRLGRAADGVTVAVLSPTDERAARKSTGASGASEPELADTALVEPEMVTDLVAHRLGDLRPQAHRIVAEVAYERVAEDQDLVGHAAAAEERRSAQPHPDVHAVRVV